MPRSRVAAAAIIGAMIAFPTPSSADELRDALDSALSSGDTNKIILLSRDHKGPAEQAEIGQWLKEKVDTGQAPDTFAQAMVFQALHNKDLPAALTYLTYYRALLLFDGAICTDPSSAGSLLEATIFLFGRLVNNPSLTVDQKRNAVDRALKMEQATASVRKKDPSLCEAGLTAYSKALHVPLAPNSETPGGGAQNAAPSATGRYIDDPVWRQKRTELLQNVKPFLLKLNGVPAGP